MKKLLLILAALAAITSASAETFKFKRADLDALAGSIMALDGYEKACDQGPGNPVRIIRENYKLGQDARSKLAADLAVLLPAARAVAQKLDDFKKEAAGLGGTYDPTNPVHRAAFAAKATPWLNNTEEFGLSPITNDDLRVGLESEGRNPIPISVHQQLLQLRPAAK